MSERAGKRTANIKVTLNKRNVRSPSNPRRNPSSRGTTN